MQYSTVQFIPVQCSKVHYSTINYITLQYSTVPTAQNIAVQKERNEEKEERKGFQQSQKKGQNGQIQ